MGNWTHWRGCESAEEAEAVAMEGTTWQEQEGDPFGPPLGAKYRVPLFWLAGFSGNDLVRLELRTDFEDDEEPFVEELAVLRAPAKDVTRRLRQRRSAILAAVHPAHADIYDAWIAYVEARFSHWILVDGSDVFSMGGIEEGNEQLEACMNALDTADDGSRFELIEPFQKMSAVDPVTEGIHRQTTAVEVVEDWMIGLVGGSDDLTWLPEPPPELLELAGRKLTGRPMEIRLEGIPRPPWWAFWRRY